MANVLKYGITVQMAIPSASLGDLDKSVNITQ